ncbi:hypothetical protein BDR26DRAFT_872854, partial [Obelidium mucronatum]
LASVPMDELASFYSRPYIWSNSMTSLDGYMHFKVTTNQLAGEAQIRHPEAGVFSLADYRLLNAEPIPSCDTVPLFKDMQQYRTSILKKPFAPFQILVSSSASTFDFHKHAMFNSADIPVIVASQPGECERAQNAFTCYTRTVHSESRTMGRCQRSGLLFELHVEYLEIDAGGSMIRKMIDAKLIDEVRLTQVGQVIGTNDSTGQPRPSLFNCIDADSYHADNSPVFRMAGVRSIGDHFLFLRTVLEYRH